MILHGISTKDTLHKPFILSGQLATLRLILEQRYDTLR